jgi:hypothetical protein
LVANAATDKGHARSHYDIHLNFEEADFYLNTELSTNFLTGMMDMELFVKDDATKKHIKIGASYWVNEESKAEVNHQATEDTSDAPFI